MDTKAPKKILAGDKPKLQEANGSGGKPGQKNDNPPDTNGAKYNQIENILEYNHRTNKFLVHWKGSKIGESTWETPHRLTKAFPEKLLPFLMDQLNMPYDEDSWVTKPSDKKIRPGYAKRTGPNQLPKGPPSPTRAERAEKRAKLKEQQETSEGARRVSRSNGRGRIRRRIRRGENEEAGNSGSNTATVTVKTEGCSNSGPAMESEVVGGRDVNPAVTVKIEGGGDSGLPRENEAEVTDPCPAVTVKAE